MTESNRGRCQEQRGHGDPKFLQMLELSGCLVTIDAMGCQAEIAEEIVKVGADYCLAVKGSQPTLHQGIVDHFDKHIMENFNTTRVRQHHAKEQGHGRRESRSYYICPGRRTCLIGIDSRS